MLEERRCFGALTMPIRLPMLVSRNFGAVQHAIAEDRVGDAVWHLQ